MGGHTIEAHMNERITRLSDTDFTVNKRAAIHVELLAEQAEALPRPLVILLTSTLAVALLNLQLLRLIQRPRLERHEARASLRLRHTRLRLVRAKAQRPHLILRPRLAHQKLLQRHLILRLRLVHQKLLRPHLILRLRLAHQKLLQRHLILRLRLVLHAEQVTARLQRLTPTPHVLRTI